ncbi:hypothetical protein BDN71DRAFT_306417 [Pleurotus eryngii]|uniref:Uncharacterized protein n=1 Tax=Pleurotus eryngii TaxID=5323 RepID=A0A9P6A4C5_PLEER|nr:hypothetical protein BDN71DRAFT_306417 [Pleurotus eryngii]
MLCWRGSILATLCLNLLVSALNFHGVGDVAVGDNVSLGLEMGKDDNFDPFDLILRSTESDRAQTMLRHIANVSSTFTVLISIPQVPDGFYIYFAAEPGYASFPARACVF